MAEQWERLPELFSYVEQLRADGRTDDEISAHLKEIASYEFDVTCQKMAADGLTPEQIEAFWAALRTDIENFEDDDPLDAVDADDPDYVAEGGA